MYLFLYSVGRNKLDSKLSGDGNHEHDTQNCRSNSISVRSGKLVSNHVTSVHVYSNNIPINQPAFEMKNG